MKGVNDSAERKSVMIFLASVLEASFTTKDRYETLAQTIQAQVVCLVNHQFTK